MRPTWCRSPPTRLMACRPRLGRRFASRLCPHCAGSVFAFEVPQAWQRRDEQVEAGNLDVAPAATPAPWMIWRPERVSNFRSLEADEAAMLDALIEGRPFPALCESNCDPCR